MAKIPPPPPRYQGFVTAEVSVTLRSETGEPIGRMSGVQLRGGLPTLKIKRITLAIQREAMRLARVIHANEMARRGEQDPDDAADDAMLSRKVKG